MNSTHRDHELIALEKIKPNPFQPRQAEDPAVIAEVAESIKKNGLLQIPSARMRRDAGSPHHYELAFGHTRLAAYKLLAAQDGAFAVMPLFVREFADREMFEIAVEENVKRRDLNAIEQARAMQRYMDEFQATSAQAGELFGLSDATVRGKVRLLDLPATAQAKLADGTISEGTARALLSMARVADEKVVLDSLKMIEENAVNWAPERILSAKLRMTNHAKVMWYGSQGGKPRGGRGLWLLDMKAFPKKLLPAFTGHTAVQALECSQDKPAQKLVIEWAEALAAGDRPSAQRCIAYLTDYNPEYPARLEHLMDPPACSGCPFHAAINGDHFCGFTSCWDRKDIAWRASQVEQASKSTGVAIYADADGKYKVLDVWNSKHEKLWEDRHADVRLIARDRVRGYHYQDRFKGFDDDFVLAIAVGKTREKWEEAERKARADEKARSDARAVRMERSTHDREMLMWEAAGQCRHLFNALNAAALGAWDDIPDMTDLPIDPPEEEGARPDFNRRALAYMMFEQAMMYDGGSSSLSASSLADWLVSTAKSWGVEVSLGSYVAPMAGSEASVATETAVPA